MTWPKKTYLPLHCELCAAMGAHNCGTRWCWRLVTFDTLITILTIENLNSWQFLLYDHNEWQWTAFAILAMFFAKTGLSGSSIWWCWLVFDFLGIIFHLFWYPKWPKTSFANWATPPFWEKFPKNVVFLASQDALGVMLFTDWLMVSIDLTDVTLVSDDTERGLDWCDSGEHRCFPVTWLMLLWWVRIKVVYC